MKILSLLFLNLVICCKNDHFAVLKNSSKSKLFKCMNYRRITNFFRMQCTTVIHQRQIGLWGTTFGYLSPIFRSCYLPKSSRCPCTHICSSASYSSVELIIHSGLDCWTCVCLLTKISKIVTSGRIDL